MQQDHHADVHAEETDVNIRAVFSFAGGLVVTLIVVGFLVWLLFNYFASRPTQSDSATFPLAASQGQELPPEPRLQTNPREDLRELRSREDEVLNGYQWVDRNAGTVRIPITEAMRLTVERGLPSRRSAETGK